VKTSFFCIGVLFFSFWSMAYAHETRPGFFELISKDTETYSVLWKRPAGGETTIRIAPEIPSGCLFSSPDGARAIAGAVIARGTLKCPAGLAGRELRIAGLEATMTDVLVRLTHSDGRIESHILRPSSPSVVIRGTESLRDLALSYVETGVRHITGGADHLLFVVGLMMIVGNGWRLLQTITSFTIAHSVTLAVATLGYTTPASGPLNLLISLSVMFLAPDVLRAARGETSLTIKSPWVIAFGFGLIHGFGFADGLSTAGLPSSAIPTALLWFNVGVEVGQLGCIAVLLSTAKALRSLDVPWDPFTSTIPAYLIGASGAFWTIERIMAMFYSASL